MLVFLLHCTAVQSRNLIANGSPNNTGAPWYVLGVNGNKVCSGTLISKDIVLTSAQCEDVFEPQNGKIYAGIQEHGGLETSRHIGIPYDFRKPVEFGYDCGFRRPCKFHQHLADIALVRISDLDCAGLQVAHLPTLAQNDFYMGGILGEEVEVISLGFTDLKKKLAPKLQKMVARRVNCEDIDKDNPDELTTPLLERNVIPGNHYTSGDKEYGVPLVDCFTDASGKGANPCPGDTGAGYIIRIGGKPIVMAVHSLSPGNCEVSRGRHFLATDVLARKEWILKTLKDMQGVPAGECPPTRGLEDITIIGLILVVTGLGCFLLTIHIRRGHLKTLRSEAEEIVHGRPNRLVKTSIVSMLSSDSKTRRHSSSSSPSMKCLLPENHQKKAAQKRLPAQSQPASMLVCAGWGSEREGTAAPSNAWKMPPSAVRTDFTTAHKSKRLKVQDPPSSMMSPSERMTYHAPGTDLTTGTVKKKKKLKQTKHS